MKVEGKTAFAMVLIVISVFILASKLMLPTSINIVVEGADHFCERDPKYLHTYRLYPDLSFIISAQGECI